MRNYQENPKIWWRHSPVPSLPSGNKTLAIAIINYAKSDRYQCFLILYYVTWFVSFPNILSGIVVYRPITSQLKSNSHMCCCEILLYLSFAWELHSTICKSKSQFFNRPDASLLCYSTYNTVNKMIKIVTLLIHP